MTFQDLEKMVATVDISKFPAPLRLKVYAPRYWDTFPHRARIAAVIEAPQRDTGEPGAFEITYPFDLDRNDAVIRQDVVDSCYRVCLTMLEHELREAFEVNGCRVFDPHLFDRSSNNGWFRAPYDPEQHVRDRDYLPIMLQPQVRKG